MKAGSIIISFCIFSFLKYVRIFGEKFGAWHLWGKLKFLTQHFAGGQFFMADLSGCDNITETETWYVWANMNVLLGYLYTLWIYEGVDITQQLTKW